MARILWNAVEPLSVDDKRTSPTTWMTNHWVNIGIFFKIGSKISRIPRFGIVPIPSTGSLGKKRNNKIGGQKNKHGMNWKSEESYWFVARRSALLNKRSFSYWIEKWKNMRERFSLLLFFYVGRSYVGGFLCWAFYVVLFRWRLKVPIYEHLQ